MPLTGIILVNYNSPDDTIECIDSILASSISDLSIVIVDNSADDNSINKICNWVKGGYTPKYEVPGLLQTCLSNKRPESVKMIYARNSESYLSESSHNFKANELTIIKNSNNVGFAAANNIGIKYLMQFSPEYIWLLNNDTVIKNDTLSNLINYFIYTKSNGINVGLIGSKILFYSDPEIIQAVGDRFNFFTTNAFHIGLNQKDHGQYDDKKFRFDYPYGASLFFTTEYVKSVGLMSEDYFLYFEELDWVIRGKKNGYKSAICTNSIVYHKQGVSTGKKIKKRKPLFIACLMYSNLLKFYWKFYPFLYPIAWLRLFFKMNLSFANGNFKESKLILKILFGFRNCSIINEKV